jgi:hypothetical protein
MYQLRNDSVELTEKNVINMIKHSNWYESSHNKRGSIYLHVYEKQKLNKNVVILDKSTSLMWQKRGSSKAMDYRTTQKYIGFLNKKVFAGFNDWRLPTLKEAISLMQANRCESTAHSLGLHISTLFDIRKEIFWTSDTILQNFPQYDEGDALFSIYTEENETWTETWAWSVDYSLGRCSDHPFHSKFFVRAVRSF